MKLSAYRDEIKLKLTGGVLDLELDDSTINKLINSAFREVQRYIDSTKIVTCPYARCIDMKDFGVSSVVRVFRAQSYMGDGTQDTTTLLSDPMYMAQWQMLSGNGSMYNLNDWVYNYASWNTALQIRNTISTDLIFRYDKTADKLYINVAFDKPQIITVEYVPLYSNVQDITSDYWIDIIVRLSVALAKVTLGRIRTRYVQSNALWVQDGATLLEEGNTELTDLRERLRVATQLTYPLD